MNDTWLQERVSEAASEWHAQPGNHWDGDETLQVWANNNPTAAVRL